MDWTVYWFMLPVCVVVASVAMFSGISGAALLTPTFLIGFPLFGVPRLTTLAAIATSLFLESSGYSRNAPGPPDRVDRIRFTAPFYRFVVPTRRPENRLSSARLGRFLLWRGRCTGSRCPHTIP